MCDVCLDISDYSRVVITQVLSLVQDLLPSVSELNTQSGKSPRADSDLPSPHYAWVESDHPYKPAGLSNYKVDT